MPHRSLRLALTAGFLVSTACRQRATRQAASDRILDSLAPGVRVGLPAAPLADRYHLPFAPYVGFGDSTATAGPGVHGLVLVVDQALASRSERPGQRARVDRVAFRLPIGSLPRLIAAISGRLGPPERRCYRTTGGGPSYDLYYWPVRGPRGILLSHPVGDRPDFVATWNTPRPDTLRVDRHACPAPPPG